MTRTAMILAAGRGERMGNLTKDTPKPLLVSKGKTLLERHLEKLSNAGFKDVVINTSYLSSQIRDYVGDGSDWNLRVTFSEESPILETAGGIRKALTLIGSDPFVVINADIYNEFDYHLLLNLHLNPNIDAHLFLTESPEHNIEGDFSLTPNNMVSNEKNKAHTFTGIAIYSKKFFYKVELGKRLKLAPYLIDAITNHRVSGQMLDAIWMDIGTPERLRCLDQL